VTIAADILSESIVLPAIEGLRCEISPDIESNRSGNSSFTLLAQVTDLQSPAIAWSE